MIRILHLADLHIGVENYGKIDPSSGLHTRLKDYLERLDEAIAVGLAAEIDLVLIAGDIYKNRSPNPTHQREFARRLAQLRSAGVPVFLLTGNHDISPALGRAHSVEIFDALDVEGVTVADRPRVHTIRTKSGLLQIVAVPWITRQTLMTREELRGASITEIDYELRRRLERFIVDSAAKLDREIPALLAFHGSVDGAQMGSERAITLGQDLVLPRSVLAQPGIGYVALGHIHKHQVLGENPPLVYPGSIERVDFGEKDEPKGCVIVEIAPCTPARWRFVPLQARPFISIEHDLRGSSDPLGTIRTLISRQNLAQAVVRVELQARVSRPPHFMNSRSGTCSKPPVPKLSPASQFRSSVAPAVASPTPIPSTVSHLAAPWNCIFSRSNRRLPPPVSRNCSPPSMSCRPKCSCAGGVAA